MAGADGSQINFSDEDDLKRVMQLRARSDGVMVGVRTVLQDDPQLTARLDKPPKQQPVRIVLDKLGRTPADAKVLDGEAPALFFTDKEAAPIPGTQQIRVDADAEELDLPQVLDSLGAMGMENIMVEGGPALLKSFLAGGYWDSFTVFQSAEALGVDAPRLWEGEDIGVLGLKVEAVDERASGTLWTFSPK